jgi:hypothetical protein
MRVAIWVAFRYASLESPVLKAPNDENPTKQSSVSRGCENQRKSQNGIEYLSNVMQVPTIPCGKSWSQEGNKLLASGAVSTCRNWPTQTALPLLFHTGPLGQLKESHGLFGSVLASCGIFNPLAGQGLLT